MKKHQDDSIIFPLVFYVYPFLCLLLQFSVEKGVLKFLPESYIGTDAVKQIHDYLTIWFFSRILIFILPVLLMMIPYIIICLKRKEKLISSTTKFILRFSLLMTILTGLCNLGCMNRFELQMKQNQYSGTKLIKTAQLIFDIEKDLQLEEVNNISAELSVFEEFYFSRSDVHPRGDVIEYAVRNAEDRTYIGQISKEDNKQAKKYCLNDQYHISIYSHSGLIASIDAGDDFNEGTLHEED